MSDPNKKKREADKKSDPEPKKVTNPPKRKSRPPRRRSSSSSSSSSSSGASRSSSSSSDGSARRHRHRQNSMLQKLTKEFSDFRNQFRVPNSSTPEHITCNNQMPDFIDANVSGSLYRDHECINNDDVVPNVPMQDSSILINTGFKINFGTTVKEPSIPVTPEPYLNTLKSIQRFEESSWCDIRYADVQKAYCHAPGFIELEANDEVNQYEFSKSMLYAERSFAAATFALLKQKEVLENGLSNFLTWTQESEGITPFDIKSKIEEIFVNGDFHKVSVDVLQLVCGHRADLIQQRREVILKQIKDPLVKSTLRKIPPSCSNLFTPALFTAALEKAGGVRKNFWPQAKSSSNAPAAQAGPSGTRQPQRPAQGCLNSCNLPAQGNINRRVPAQGNSCNQHNLPAQGNYYQNRQCCPAQGPNNGGYNRRVPARNGGPFRARPTSSFQEARGAAKRPSSPNNKFKSNKRRKY
ncbi:hypothetical protein O0L34_g12961 [Tuta absoluta]|nr:hypothetical protein O0L34_g12961 [Tuta absoluta]